eukprot:5596028-Prymnesium_polylepis.1
MAGAAAGGGAIECGSPVGGRTGGLAGSSRAPPPHRRDGTIHHIMIFIVAMARCADLSTSFDFSTSFATCQLPLR